MKQNAPGKGKKLCNCGEYVGARTSTHSCGHSFKAKVPASGETNPARELVRGKTNESPDMIPYKPHPSNGITSYLVFIPSGICPFKLENFTKKGIIDWADKVFDENVKRGCILSVAALKYWADKFTKYDEKEKRETIGSTLLAHASQGSNPKASSGALDYERKSQKGEGESRTKKRR